mmetsp:Transcript_10021/g.23428  ORF Transcript_10021/g.23428 Transcript_10021/m.23428 type:complete len:82 (+) Transcript_10021:85-330(+)
MLLFPQLHGRNRTRKYSLSQIQSMSTQATFSNPIERAIFPLNTEERESYPLKNYDINFAPKTLLICSSRAANHSDCFFLSA